MKLDLFEQNVSFYYVLLSMRWKSCGFLSQCMCSAIQTRMSIEYDSEGNLCLWFWGKKVLRKLKELVSWARKYTAPGEFTFSS